MPKLLRFVLVYAVLPVTVIVAASLAWLRWDAGRPLDARFDERAGNLAGAAVLESSASSGQASQFIRLGSDTGLQVSIRVIRKIDATRPLPVLIILGGHRTGSDAAELFGAVGERAVVALDYPYAGPDKVRGLGQTLKTVPLARKAFIDTPPAVTLTIDWLEDQDWADPAQLVIVGASLGAPFAALAAARDSRLSGALLVHGAADNRVWLEAQLVRRIDSPLLHRPLATVIWWLAYGPTFDTAKNVARISPRPVVIIGARADERTPAGQTEALFAAALEPKTLRWSEGQHVDPGQTGIISELLRIADEELPFPAKKR